ncbi:MAG: BPSS1780 family membrane protein [Pedobacter sp.]|nr:BPSS1780 family membrane protein [Pedobacter sp.]
MSSPLNPYRPPEATVTDVPEYGAEVLFAAPAARVDASRGVSWIGEGWALFKLAPALWIVALVILFAIQMVLGFLPLIGSIASLLIGPLFMAGLLAFAHGLAQGEEADLGRLFVGFREKTGPLVTVALLYALLIVGVVVVAAVLIAVLLGAGSSAFESNDPEQIVASLLAGGSGLLMLVVALVALAAIFLIAAAYWFAPGLVFYTDLGAVAAMKASFAACLRNWLPFLLYSIVGFFVLLGGTLALVIGLLVAVPVLMASYYASFRDLFGQVR